MRNLFAILLTTSVLAINAGPSLAQSGPFTIDECIETLVTPKGAEASSAANRDGSTDNPRGDYSNLPVPSVDTNNDGKISREEARVACSASKMQNDAETQER